MKASPDLSFSHLLDSYKLLFDKKVENHLDELGPKNLVRDACEYALLNGGKRFRPALVLMIVKALGFGVDVSQAALGIEFFHTASLIADDLPCMDNDDERRNKPSVHRLFGESVALLATYALISAGYACLAKNARQIEISSFHPFAHQSDRLCLLALENATFNTGLFGATGGQFLDLSPSPPTLSFIREVIHKKTVTLFEISFVLGWLFGGGNEADLSCVKKCAGHFGLAFQIADDLDDMSQDLANNRPINLANAFGKEYAIQLFHEEMDQFDQALKELRLNEGELHSLAQLLRLQVSKDTP